MHDEYNCLEGCCVECWCVADEEVEAVEYDPRQPPLFEPSELTLCETCFLLAVDERLFELEEEIDDLKVRRGKYSSSI